MQSLNSESPQAQAGAEQRPAGGTQRPAGGTKRPASAGSYTASETGNPFVPGTIAEAPPSPSAATVMAPSGVPETLIGGVIQYTANGSLAASVMVLCFALSAFFWFPAGGVLVSALGLGLAAGALFSDRRFTATAVLLVHLGLFLACYAASALA